MNRQSHVFAELFLSFSDTPRRSTASAGPPQWIGHYHTMNECRKKLVSLRVGRPHQKQHSAHCCFRADEIRVNRCQFRRRRVTLMRVNLTLLTQVLCTYTERILNATIDVLSFTNLPATTISSLSLTLLLCFHGMNSIPQMISQLLPLDSSLRSLLISVDWYLCFRLVVYGVLPACFGICGCSFVAAMSFGTNSTEALVLSGLAGVMLMESLVPLTFALSFGMYLMDALQFHNAAMISVLVGCLANSISRNLRNVIYTNIGLD
jgi:hypothetical protein